MKKYSRPKLIYEGRPKLAYNKNQASRMLDISAGVFRYLLATGRLPHPTHLIGARYYYSEDDILDLASAYDKWQKDREERSFLYSKDEVCRVLGVCRPVLDWHLKHDCFPKPTKITNNGHFFDADQVATIKRYFDMRKKADKTLTLLQPGLEEIGATKAEVAYICGRHRDLIPDPVIVLPGNGLRRNYYHQKDIKALLKKVRILRQEKN